MRGAGDLPASRLQRLPPLERREDRVQDSHEVAVDFVIMKASRPVASIAQDLFSCAIATALVVGRMCRAVDLDNKFLVAADEVGEIRANRLLPNELEPAEKAVSKAPPKLAFGLGLVSPQRASSARFMQAESAQSLCPSP